MTSSPTSSMTTFEYWWRRLTRSIILPTDDMEEISRKISCLVYGTAFVFGFVGIYGLATMAGEPEETRPARIASGVLVIVWGFCVSFPTLIYVVYTKTAPIALTTYLLWSTFALAVGGDIVTTFFGTGMVLLTITALAIQAALPSANYLGFASFLYIIFRSIRDSFDLPLRLKHPIDGPSGIRLAYSSCDYIVILVIILLNNVARWEQLKMLEAAQSDVRVARVVANHILDYNTDKVKETLDTAVEDVVIQGDLDWVEPSRASKPLVAAFRQINQNLEQWKPLLPEWAIARRQTGRHSDNNDEDEGSLLFSDNEDEGLLSGGLFSQSSCASDREGVRRQTSASILMNSQGIDSDNSHKKLKDNNNNKKKPHYMQHDKRSWEAGSDNDSTSDSVTGSTATKSALGKNQLTGASILKGSFIDRVVVCRINLSKLPNFLISAYQQEHRHSSSSNKRFLSQISARFNKITELLLDTAFANSASVHAIYSDCVYVSWNATMRVPSADSKALKFLMSFEQQLFTSLRETAKEVDEENSLMMMAAVKTGSTKPVAGGGGGGEPLYRSNGRAASAVATGEGSSSSSILPIVSTSPSSAATSAVNAGAVIDEPTSSTASPPPGSSSPSSPLTTQLDDMKRRGERLFSAAVVNGSCFAQVAGNTKRQQFVLSTFSNKDAFEQACVLADSSSSSSSSSPSIVVSKSICFNLSHEYTFRGRGIAVPSKYTDLFMKSVFGSCQDDAVQATPEKKKKKQELNEAVPEDDIGDGNLCNINVPQSQEEASKSNSATNANTGVASSFVEAAKFERVFSQLYELVAAKKSDRNNLEWMYAQQQQQQQPSDQGNDRNSSLTSASASAAAVNGLTTEIVQLLSRGQIEIANEFIRKEQQRVDCNNDTMMAMALKQMSQCVRLVSNVKSELIP